MVIFFVAAGTDNSDEARDFDLPLKNRFYLQPLPAAEAAARAKESAQDILKLKPLIDRKQWPYVMNDLRLRASYLRYDLKTVIASKATKEEKKSLKDLTGKLFDTLDGVNISQFQIPYFSSDILQLAFQKHDQ
jgi:photosystem II oxygen-evolving enhancer protein 3